MMIKKICKTLLCVVLISGLVMPLYAAQDMNGEGAAFITKEEFDIALADFNKRLSIFESGINSKIDSQVTSYLDRNGIWSGKKQSLLNDHYVWAYNVTVGTNLSYVDGKTYPVTETGWSAVGTVSAGNIYTVRDKLYKLVDKIDKAGLCCLEYAIYSNGTSLNNSYFANDSARRGWYQICGTPRNSAVSWDPKIYIYHPTDYAIASRDISNSVASFQVYYPTYGHISDVGWYFQPQPSAGALYFFVEKGYSLYYNDWLTCQPNTANGASAISGQGVGNYGNNYVGYRIDFNNVEVY